MSAAPQSPVPGPALFFGDSDMAARLRAFDWSLSPLGPPEQWPMALRSAVSLMLDSSFPICVGWGPDLAMLYNDAYSAMLGDRHPDSIGKAAHLVLHDSWAMLAPLVRDAMEGRPVFFEDMPMSVTRNGKIDQAWFSFTYSPLRDESGRPAGICCICSETTAKVLSMNRQALRLALEQGIHGLSQPEDIMRAACELLAHHVQADRAGFGELHPEAATITFQADWTAPGIASLEGRQFPLKSFRPALVDGLLAGRTVRTIDALDDPFVAGNIGTANLADIGARSGVTVPLVREGRVAAVMFVHSAAPRAWRDHEESLVREVGERIWDAVKRARAEVALRESEKRFRNMADHAPVMVWTTNPEGYCTYLNRAWYEFTGQQESGGIGYGWLDAIHDDDRPRTEATFLNANRDRLPYRAEFRLRRHDGVYRWAVDASAPRFGADGEFLGYVGSVLDVDELKSAEAAQAASNARFRAAIDAVEGVLWTNDSSGQMTDEQPGWAALTGQSFEEYRGYGWAQAVHPDDAQPTIAAWKQAVAERQPFLFEHRLRRHDGAWRHYFVRAIPTFDQAGNIREWIGVHTDITELRRTEEALRQLNARLEAGIEQRTRERDRLWRMSQDVMAIATLDGYFISVNPAFTATLGWTEEEATSVPLIELTHPDHRHELAGKLEHLAQGKPLPRYEVRDLHKDGSYRWLSWTVVPEGRLLYGVGRDITLEKRQAEALLHAEEALRQAQKMEAVGQLTGGLAHDFNNLLASMVSNLELMKMRVEAGRSADIMRYIDGAMTVADRAAALTHRLLAFSRRQTLAPKPVDVNRLIESMIELIQRTVGPAVRVRTVLAAQIWNTRCDPNQLESALLNLAINARDAMPEGGTLTIETGNLTLDAAYVTEYPDVAPGEYVCITVTDTGTGMTSDVAARAFDPFFTTKPLGQGTGLGLSMIYGFVKQSGGHIRLHSSPGAGTILRLKMPRYLGELPNENGSPREGEPQRAAARSHVLVVDDEAPLRKLLAEMTEMLGYATLQAGDAREGLSYIESDARIDLLITDVGLPGGMNGRQLADAARTVRPDLKILFITGYAENAAMRNGMLDPGMQVMTKPFMMDAFADRIRKMLSE